jgi:hypothetical protein
VFGGLPDRREVVCSGMRSRRGVRERNEGQLLEEEAVNEELPKGKGENRNEGILMPPRQRVRLCDGLTTLTLLASLLTRARPSNGLSRCLRQIEDL